MPIVLSIVDWIPVLYCGQWWWVLDGGGGVKGDIGAELMESVASHRTPSVSSRNKVRPRRYDEEVSTIDAPDALTMLSKCLAVLASLFLGSGG